MKRSPLLRSKRLVAVKSVFLASALTASLPATSPHVSATKYNLPELGDASSAYVSPQREYKLGQAWLRMFRSRVPAYTDPLIYSYVDDLLDSLAEHSDIKQKSFDLIVVKNPTLNAFAVPGGVVGVHTGLFNYAQSEDQFASVLAHELAHLSQRHYARNVENQQQNQIPMMAAMLASLVLLATAGGDAGIAALTATQAAALNQQLRFSRLNEQEADRIGMQTLSASGRDPHAMVDMFEQMLRASRYSRRPPEFLLTHPLTENRVADATNRARNYPLRQTEVVLNYQLIRARAMFAQQSSPQEAAKYFRGQIEGETISIDASRYGLVLSLAASQQPEEAQKELNTLLTAQPNNLLYQMAQVDVFVAQQDYTAARKTLESLLQTNIGHHGLTVKYAETLLEMGDFPASESVLKQHVLNYPKDDYLWYLLAEVHGLAGDIQSVHTARAEYFVLNGVFDKAQFHLTKALELTPRESLQYTIIRQRQKDIRLMQEEQQSL